MQIIWTYRAPFDALITYMPVFTQPDTETRGLSDAQHFPSLALCVWITRRSASRLKNSAKAEEKCQKWNHCGKLLFCEMSRVTVNLIIKMKSALSSIRLQMSSSTAAQDQQICSVWNEDWFWRVPSSQSVRRKNALIITTISSRMSHNIIKCFHQVDE